MNANPNGSESATCGVDGNASVSVSAAWTAIGSANEIEIESGSEGNENGRNVYGGYTRRARVRIRVLSAARYRSDRNRGRASDGHHGSLGVAACHAHPYFPSENGEIKWARGVGS